jgi:hypothetical protein
VFRRLAAAVALAIGVACVPTDDTADPLAALLSGEDTATVAARLAAIQADRDAQAGVPVRRRVLDRPPIQDLPIVWDRDRMELTAEHLSHHLDMDVPDDPDRASRMDPRVVVLHWTAGPTAKSAFWTFFKPRRHRPRNPHHQLNLSVHFVVDRDGTIYQLMDTDRVACHVVGLNHLAIGVENVGDRQRWPLTPAQITANIALVRYLAQKHDLTHLIGHYEFKRFHGHPYWKGPPGHHIGRADPGEAFMARVRSGVKDLGLGGAPDADLSVRPLALVRPR